MLPMHRRSVAMSCVALTILHVASVAIPAQQAQSITQAPAPGSRQFTATDLQGWKTIRSAALSADGRWFAYIVSPNEGDASVVIVSTGDTTKQHKFAIGEMPQAGGGAGAAAAGSPLTLSGDSKWAAFTIYPTRAEARRARTARRPLQNKIAIVNLATGEKKV